MLHVLAGIEHEATLRRCCVDSVHDFGPYDGVVYHEFIFHSSVAVFPDIQSYRTFVFSCLYFSLLFSRHPKYLTSFVLGACSQLANLTVDC